MNKKTLIGLAAFVVLVIGGVWTVWAFSDNAQESMTPSVATTTDTATLPPAPQPETQSDTATLNQRIFDNDVHITPLAVVEDSRCPKDVQCIQAGTVRITVKLEDAAHTQTVTAVLGSPISFGNKHVTLMSVTPDKNSKVAIKPSDYHFTFSVAFGMGGDAP